MTFDLTGLTEKKNRKGTKYFEDNKGDIVAKECSRCGLVKSLRHYGKHKGCLAGVNSECKRCASERARKYRIEHKDSLSFIEDRRERGRKWREENPTYFREYYKRNREQVLEANYRWAKLNRDKMREYNRRYAANNPDKVRDSRKRWEENNPEKLIMKTQKRLARRRSLPDSITEEQRKYILVKFSYGCALTGESDYHWDHVIPLATGHGGTIYENMIPLRADLNISKSNRNIFEWFADNRERFGLSQRKFDELIEYLADINEMTVEEYRDYVYWCHDNPRTVGEITEERAKA